MCVQDVQVPLLLLLIKLWLGHPTVWVGLFSTHPRTPNPSSVSSRVWLLWTLLRSHRASAGISQVHNGHHPGKQRPHVRAWTAPARARQLPLHALLPALRTRRFPGSQHGSCSHLPLHPRGFTERAARALRPRSSDPWCLPRAGPPKDGKRARRATSERQGHRACPGVRGGGLPGVWEGLLPSEAPGGGSFAAIGPLTLGPGERGSAFSVGSVCSARNCWGSHRTLDLHHSAQPSGSPSLVNLSRRWPQIIADQWAT